MAAIRSIRREDLNVRRVVDLYTRDGGTQAMLHKVPKEELEHQSVG
jgi:hypothetical protein